MLYQADTKSFQTKSLAQLEGAPWNSGDLQCFAKSWAYWASEASRMREAGNADLWAHYVRNAVNVRIALQACIQVIAERRAAGEINFATGC